MNKFITFLSLVFLAGAPLLAQDDDTALGSTEVPEVPAVTAALAEAEYVSDARPKAKTKIYFLYKSHSRCRACCMAMPKLIAAYKKMSKKGAEIVMLNGDPNVATAEAWLKKEGCNFPVVAPGKKQLDIPFPFDMSKAGMPPHMVAVTPDGKALGQASGLDVANFAGEWKSILSDARKAEKKAKAAAKRAAKKAKKEAEEAAEATSDESDTIADTEEEDSKAAKKKSKKRKSRKAQKDDDSFDF